MSITLRPYQIKAKEEIYQSWDNGHKNVLLVMPTGLGKSKTFCSIAIDMAVTPKDKSPVAIMVHRKELVQQISLTLAEEGVMHNIIAPRPVILGIIGAHRRVLKKQFYDYNSPITVISVDTLNARILKHEQWAKKIKYWITDEAAHLLKTNKWGRAVEYFPTARGLGVTATPERLDRRGLGRHADGVFDTMVMGPTTKWGILNGFLCDYKIVIPKSDYRDFLDQGKSNDSDYTNDARAKASLKSHIVGNVVKDYIKWADGKQSILFADNIDSGERMEKEFLSKGIPAKLLTGETPDQERLQGLLDFRDKKTKVLLNVDLFDEGLDVPGIECVQMARPTKSFGKFRQMIGRGMRPAKEKEFLIIIDHVGNIDEHGLPDGHHKWTLDRIVKRREKLNLLRVCISCNAPYDRTLTECPYCGVEPEIGSRDGGGGGRLSLQQVDGDLIMLDRETLEAMFSKTVLESPADVASRVGAVAGGPAAMRAMKNQTERITTQKELVEVIALWAGKLRHQGYTDRRIHKHVYLQHEATFTEMLSKPRKEMINHIENLLSDLRDTQ